MIVFNYEFFLHDEETLEEFCSMLRQETYNDESRIGIEVLIQYLHECFLADKELTEVVHKRIGDDVIPIVLIECSEYADLTELNFTIISNDENREISAREELVFSESCNICFKDIKCLYDRFCIAAQNQ